MGSLSDGGNRNEENRKEEGEGSYICHRLHPPSPPSPTSNSARSPDLYGVVKEACAQQNVKWPVECQVLVDKVHHIEDWPLYPEPFYQQTGGELRPQPVGEELGRVVYQYYPTSAVNYFSRSCVGGNKHVSDDVRPPLIDENDTTLQFESRFECGNLAKALQVSECYYELYIRSDLYTSRHTQWFYFAISNTRKDITYRLSIVNLMKGDSLYNHGLRPILYSTIEADLHSVGWRRCANNIVYFRNQDNDSGCYDSDDDGDDDAPSYTLTFNLTFPHDHDTVYIAHCYPYTFSDLQQHLLNIQNDPYKSEICRQRILCRSLAGNPIYLLTITSHDNEEDVKQKKRAIVLTGRIHPGETPASWIMKGVLEFITSEHPKAIELRRQFVFKIIPMLNPDGVIVGNHRCSLVGRDLNRQYKMVVKEMFPSIWHTKAMVRRLMDEHGVVMYCDFHAHSRKHNVFVYGCENRRSHENHLREQIFPLLLHYNAGDKFSFRNCKFKVQRCKEGTARVVVWMMGVLHSFTLESSFGGASEGPRSSTHFSILDFLAMGRQFCETLHEYFDPQPVKEKLRNKLWSRLIKKGSSADEPTTVDLSDTNSSSEESDKQVLPARIRKKKLVKSGKKKVIPSRTTVAQVVERVTSQIRMETAERRVRNGLSACEISPNPGRKHHERQSINHITQTCANLPSPAASPRRGRYMVSGLLNSPRKRLLNNGGNNNSLSFSTPNNSPKLPARNFGLNRQRSSTGDETTVSHSMRHRSKSIALPHSAPLLSNRKSSPTPTRTSSVSSTGSSPLAPNHSSSPPPQQDIGEATGVVAGMDRTTKTYMERMEEMLASRLALSDHEGENVSSFWDSGISSPGGSGNMKNNSSHRYPHVRSESIGSSIEKFDALEPVVAKTRLHDPRLSHQPRMGAGAHTLYKSFKTAHFIHRGTARRTPHRDKVHDSIRVKKRDRDSKRGSISEIPSKNCLEKISNLKVKFASMREDKISKKSSETSNKINNRLKQNSIDVHPSPNPNPEVNQNQGKEISDDNNIIERENNPEESNKNEYHVFQSHPTPLIMGMCQDLIESPLQDNSNLDNAENGCDGNVVVSLKVPQNICHVNSNEKQIEKPEKPAKSSKKLSKKPSCVEDIDNEQLCADIAACDTLFLDIGTKETPELIAARNLKVKVKKKKVSSSGSDTTGLENINDDENNKIYSDTSLKESVQPETKVKKKIKIVIGKKSKTKTKRKNINKIEEAS